MVIVLYTWSNATDVGRRAPGLGIESAGAPVSSSMASSDIDWPFAGKASIIIAIMGFKITSVFRVGPAVSLVNKRVRNGLIQLVFFMLDKGFLNGD